MFDDILINFDGFLLPSDPQEAYNEGFNSGYGVSGGSSVSGAAYDKGKRDGLEERLSSLDYDNADIE